MPIIKIETPLSQTSPTPVPAAHNHSVSNPKSNGDSKSPAHNQITTTQPNTTTYRSTAPESPSKKIPTVVGECYGKIADLEAHVPAKWWTALFADALYLKTDGDCVEDPLITRHEANQLLSDKRISKLLSSASETNVVKVLDLCCGQGRHSVFLAQRYSMVQFYGHDQSKYLIDLAIHRASKAQYVDVNDAPTGNSFGYFSSDEGDRRVLAEIARVAKEDAIMVIDLTDGEYMRSSFSARSWEWIDDTTFACRERQLSKDSKRLISREVVCVSGTGVIRDQFYQERLYGRDEVQDLMRDAGFDCDFGGDDDEIVTAAKEFSKRNEDLGMMEQRMLVKGVKRSTKTLDVNGTNADAVKPLSFPMLSVLLGDVTKPCFGKLNDTWNKEDHVTRDKLVEALYSLGYTASTLEVMSSHDTLIPSLTKSKHPVLNFCDEGFRNNALSELHVPALLEIMGLPYTGAGPACLAICYDKGLVSRSAEALGIPIPNEVFICDINNLNARAEQFKHITYPAFIKPMKGDNSLGITTRSVVNDWNEILIYIEELKALGICDVICQEYLEGAEYSVGMIGNTTDGFTFLPILEVDYTKLTSKHLVPILGYESKWQPDSPYWTDISFKEATLTETQQQKLQLDCKKMWARFGCRDYARFDFRSDKDGAIKLLEANPNPGWCWDGKFSVMCGMRGIAYRDMIEMILDAAGERLKNV